MDSTFPAEHRSRPDGELLQRYVDSRDDAALTELITRHATLVRGVCRRVLGDTPDADDAFQATFLVLIRSGDRIHRPSSLAAWLYGVAHRIAKRQRRHQVRPVRLVPEEQAMVAEDPLTALATQHDISLFDAELARLPEKYRAPIVLHHLEGKSQRDVAAELQLTEGAVDGLLKRGRNELRVRLARRGVIFGVTLAAIQSAQATAALAAPAGLIESTVQGVLTLDPVLNPEFPRTPPARLAQQEISTMGLFQATKVVAWSAVASLVLGGAGIGVSTARHITTHQAAGVIASELAVAQTDSGTEVAQAADDSEDAAQQKPATREGVILSVDPAQKLVEISLGKDDEVQPKDRFIITSLRNGVRSFKGLLEVIRVVEDRAVATIIHQNNDDPIARGDEAATSPELRQEQADAEAETDVRSAANFREGKLSDHPILKKLDERTELSFVDTSLRDALDFISQLHQFNIWVDQEAIKAGGASFDQTINLELSGVTLRSGLRLMLEPTGLDFVLEDEVMKITSRKAAENQHEERVYKLEPLWTGADAQGNRLEFSPGAGSDMARRLEALVKDTVGGAWKEPGTAGLGGTIQVIPEGLAVRHNQRTQLAVERMLAQLTKNESAPNDSKSEQAAAAAPSGVILRVDPDTKTVVLRLGTEHHVRPRMSFQVFGQSSEGKNVAKGKVEIVRVLGPQASEAKIVEEDLLRPIVAGDGTEAILNHKGERISIIGGIDLDGDGKSDRERFHKLLEDAGMKIEIEVDEDATRSENLGGEEYKFLVIAHLPDFRGTGNRKGREKLGQLMDHLKDLRKDARLKGVRIIALDDFLAYIGQPPALRTVEFRPPAVSYRQQNPSEARIATSLNEQTQVSFVDTSLDQALGYLEDLHNIEIMINERELIEEGLSPKEMVITFERNGGELRTALNLMLEPLELDYILKDEVLMITTKKHAARHQELRVYNLDGLRDVFSTDDDVARYWESLVKDAVAGEWKSAEGKGEGGTLHLTPQGLAVRQTQRTHREIENLLDQLRRANGEK